MAMKTISIMKDKMQLWLMRISFLNQMKTMERKEKEVRKKRKQDKQLLLENNKNMTKRWEEIQNLQFSTCTQEINLTKKTTIKLLSKQQEDFKLCLTVSLKPRQVPYLLLRKDK